MAAETAARLTVGEVMPNFIYDTPFATGLTLSDTVQKTPKTALLFLRYYGCTLCQYDIHQLAENYHQITDVGGQVIVVLQSDPTGLPAISLLCTPYALREKKNQRIFVYIKCSAIQTTFLSRKYAFQAADFQDDAVWGVIWLADK